MHEQGNEVSEAESRAVRAAESQAVREAIVTSLATIIGLVLLFCLGYFLMVRAFLG